MRIAICDDDKAIRDILKKELRKIRADAEIDLYPTGLAYLDSSIPADILLLDIEMPGINGLELAAKIRKAGHDTVIIFISGEDKYVWQSFEVEAFQYLRKPFSVKELKDTMERAFIKYAKDSSSEERPSMMIHYKGIHEKVFLSDIVYAEAMGRKVILHRMNDSLEYYGKISDLEKLLGGDFFRVHRAFLINLNYVVRYEADGITMKKGYVNISKANYPHFVKSFLAFTAEKTEKRRTL